MADEFGILERLRGRVHDAKMDHEQMMDDAADEIERLRAALERIANHTDLNGDVPHNVDGLMLLARAALCTSNRREVEK